MTEKDVSETIEDGENSSKNVVDLEMKSPSEDRAFFLFRDYKAII